MLPDFDKMRGTKKLRDMMRDGVPFSVRGQVWTKAIGNTLAIKPADYEQLIAKLAKFHRSLEIEAEAEAAEAAVRRKGDGDGEVDAAGEASPPFGAEAAAAEAPEPEPEPDEGGCFGVDTVGDGNSSPPRAPTAEEARALGLINKDIDRTFSHWVTNLCSSNSPLYQVARSRAGVCPRPRPPRCLLVSLPSLAYPPARAAVPASLFSLLPRLLRAPSVSASAHRKIG